MAARFASGHECQAPQAALATAWCPPRGRKSTLTPFFSSVWPVRDAAPIWRPTWQAGYDAFFLPPSRVKFQKVVQRGGPRSALGLSILLGQAISALPRTAVMTPPRASR